MKSDDLRLDSLLEQKTVFVLGAGASKDYGFPDWGELSDKIDEEIKSKTVLNGTIKNKTPDKYKNFKASYAEYKKITENSDYNNYTLDKILAVLDENVGKDTASNIMTLVGIILSGYERSDLLSSEDGWVDTFRTILLDMVSEDKSTNIDKLLSNLRIINLNYDKSFAYHLSDSFVTDFMVRQGFDDQIKSTGHKLKIKHSPFEILNPHGSIFNLSKKSEGDLNIGISHETVWSHIDQNGYRNSPYGKQLDFHELIRLGDDIVPVDITRTEDYVRANGFVREAKNIIIIGVSVSGLEQSRFDPDCFSNKSKLVYAIDPEKIEKGYKEANSIRLKKGRFNLVEFQFINEHSKTFVNRLRIDK